MKAHLGKVAGAAMVVALAGCATLPPSGPAVTALPGAGKSFDQFRYDQAECQQYAQATVGVTPDQAATNSAVDSAAAGTVLGAAAGALIGAASGNPAAGAAWGAGTGLLVGGVAGTDAYGATGYALQERYDGAYLQCMYAKGNQVPVPAGYQGAYQPAYQQPTSQPPAALPPPPPPPPGYQAVPPGNYVPPPRSAPPGAS